MFRNQCRESKKMKKYEYIFQTNEQDNLQTDVNKTEISDFSNKELKIMVIKMLTIVTKTMQEQRISTTRY